MSPDGSIIVFSSPRSGQGDIYRINADGSESHRLTTDPSFDTDPIFSPDGSSIAFTRETDGCRHAWLMAPDGTDQKQITSGSVLDDLQSFSPDGSELLLSRSGLSMGMGRSVEYIAVNLETKDVRKLDAFPVYSPDGKSILYDTVNAGRFEVWVMSVDGSNKRFLAIGHSPRFSPDGESILYSAESKVSHPGGLWKMIATDGSNERQLGRMEFPEFTSDGKHIVYLNPSYEREIWRMDVDGNDAKRLIAPVGYIDFLRPCRPGFILKLVTDDRVGEIYLIDADSWTVQRIASMN